MENNLNQNNHQDIYDEMHGTKNIDTKQLDKVTKLKIGKALITIIFGVFMGVVMFSLVYQCGRLSAYSDILKKQYDSGYRWMKPADTSEHSESIEPEKYVEPESMCK